MEKEAPIFLLLVSAHHFWQCSLDWYASVFRRESLGDRSAARFIAPLASYIDIKVFNSKSDL